jgi:uncharacterized protein YbjT (DUF2867 family)
LAEKKIIAVMGATGAQGGGLVRAIQADRGGPFRARAITRDAGSDKAKAVAQLGAEVVSANADDMESLKKAFAGAHAAYCVTFFWEHFSPDKEMAHAKNMAQAAKQAGVQHAVWSTLEDTRKFVPLSDNRMPTLMGNYKVPHFDAKGESDRFFTEAGVPTTFLLTSFYWENMIFFGMGPKKGPDGTLALTPAAPRREVPADRGRGHRQVRLRDLQEGRRAIGKTVGVAGEHLTGTPDGRRAVQGARPGGPLQRRLARRLSEVRLPGRRRPGEHVPVQPGIRGCLLRRAQRRGLPAPEPRAADVSTSGWPGTRADPAGVGRKSRGDGEGRV